MNDLHETKISTAQWWACDLPGNAGWIIWLICTWKCLAQGITVFSVLTLLPAILMIIGIIEIIGERIARAKETANKKFEGWTSPDDFAKAKEEFAKAEEDYKKQISDLQAAAAETEKIIAEKDATIAKADQYRTDLEKTRIALAARCLPQTCSVA